MYKPPRNKLPKRHLQITILLNIPINSNWLFTSIDDDLRFEGVFTRTHRNNIISIECDVALVDSHKVGVHRRTKRWERLQWAIPRSTPKGRWRLNWTTLASTSERGFVADGGESFRTSIGLCRLKEGHRRIRENCRGAKAKGIYCTTCRRARKRGTKGRHVEKK